MALLLRFQEANANAQNALLKTLEEAPARVVLLLTADSPDDLLPTIVSRCEVMRLRPRRWSGWRASCSRASGNPPRQDCWRIFPAGGWATRCACRPTRQGSSSAASCWICSTCWRRTGAGRFKYAEELTKGERAREPVRQAFLTWLSAWRDVLLAAADPGLLLANPDCEGDIRRLAGEVGLRQARRCVRELERGLTRLDANVNPRLLAEVSCWIGRRYSP